MNQHVNPTLAPPQPNKDGILQHLWALFPAEFAHKFPDGKIEIAYGKPGSLDRAELFSVFKLEDAVNFAVAKNAEGNNVYVGPALRRGETPPFGRASDKDFLASHLAWTDHDGAGELEHAKATMRERSLAPAMYVGTGTTPHPRAHTYFKLAEPITDGEIMRSINAALISCLGGDAVQDPSRVLRLAGTVNYPTEKKRARGYVTEPVTILADKKPREHKAETIKGLHSSSAKSSATDIARSKDILGFDMPRSDAEIRALLETSKGDKWHIPVRSAVASMVGYGWSDLQIRLACAQYCTGNFSDPDLTKFISSARAKFSKPDPASSATPLPGRLVISSAEFVDGFTAPDYLVDGIFQRRYLYSITAPTGAGKTSVALLIAACVGLGRPMGAIEVEQGRVLYLAGENPDDVRARWIAMAERMGFDPRTTRWE